MCVEILHICPIPHITKLDALAYMKQKLAEMPDFLKDNYYIDHIYDNIMNDPNRGSRPLISSIHLSDLHVDFEYKEGLPAECNFTICCRDNAKE